MQKSELGVYLLVLCSQLELLTAAHHPVPTVREAEADSFSERQRCCLDGTCSAGADIRG